MGNLKQIQDELTRLTIFWTAIDVIAFIVGMWVLYIVIKNAIRDGINESNLNNRWKTTVAAAIRREEIAKSIPEMKAEK